MACLEDPTLVLNRSWVAISTTTVREAVSMVYRGVAKAIQPETWQTHTFESWADLNVLEGEPALHTVRLAMRVPEVILLTRNTRMPPRQVPFSRRNLYRRDGYRCQYCGHRQLTQELSIDHVLPRSLGGGTSWENCVLACLSCNVRKANRTPSEAGLALLRLPERPPWSPCLLVQLGRRRASWEKFVSDQYWNVALEEG